MPLAATRELYRSAVAILRGGGSSLAAPFAVPGLVAAVTYTPSDADLAALPAHVSLARMLAYARSGTADGYDSQESIHCALNAIEWLLTGLSVPVRDDVREALQAAAARAHLAQGLPVPRAWLAALAGVSSTTVCDAIAAGALATCAPRGAGTRRGSPALDVTAASARAWLLSRGVEGLT